MVIRSPCLLRTKSVINFTPMTSQKQVHRNDDVRGASDFLKKKSGIRCFSENGTEARRHSKIHFRNMYGAKRSKVTWE